MNRTFIIVALCLLMAVTAQVPTQDPDPVKPSQNAAAGYGRCYEQEVKMLYAATDPQDPLQQQYLWAAEAYRQLEEMRQTC